MHGNYKSLVVIAVLGGALVAVAGVLASMQSRQPASNAKSTRQLPELAATSNVSVEAKPQPEIVAAIAKMRNILENLPANTPPLESPASKVLQQACHLVTPADWPAISAELGRQDLPDGLRSLLILLAGASKNDAAVPVLLELYGRFPVRVAESLARIGSMTAFRTLVDLYSRSSTFEEKFGLLTKIPRFPMDGGAEFLAHHLSSEKDRRVVFELVTMARHVKHEQLVENLTHLFLQPEWRNDTELAARILNSLGGLKVNGSDRRIFDLKRQTDLSPQQRAAADEAFRFLKAPHLVAEVTRELAEGFKPDNDVLVFLTRNARSSDFPALDPHFESAGEPLWSAWKEARKTIQAAGN